MATLNQIKLPVRGIVILAVLTMSATHFAQAQDNSIPSDLVGQEESIARGVLSGNLIETNFRNHGELARWNDAPWGVWPRGIGGRHIDGIGIMVSGIVPGERAAYPQFFGGLPDTTVNPVILTYREAGKRLGPSGEIWGWLPLPGFNNTNRLDPITGQRTPTPAQSSDPTSWPESWPDRLNNPDDPGWAGNWNGFFGKGVFNADEESFYVMDDYSDLEYQIDDVTGQPVSEEGIFYANPADSSIGGLGLQNQVRIFQWANVLAEDLMFILYRVNNAGGFDHDRLFFSQVMDYGLGNEEGDENASFNPQEDVTFGWDQDGIGTRPTGGTYDLGYTGFAFLESPARTFDGLDNDEDGITDESRFSGPGTRITGSSAIQASVAGMYDVVAFETFNGPVDKRPAVEAGIWWTGDENLDWVGLEDDNNNGMWDQGESLNNDVGRDGLGPFDLGYPGPDDGEADGIPTAGEPNFDELDVDESDQIGLTGFDLNTRPFYETGDNLRDDTWLFERITLAQFPLGTKPEAFVADVEPFLLFNSGPVPLAPGSVDFFSTAWIFGADETDFFKNRRTAQSIFNADYNFAQPPFLPKLTAVPGDGRVILSWDTTSVASFDRFTQTFDFEGYKLYKGTDALLSDAKVITDLNGTPQFFRPLQQWDLDNGINGPITVLGGEGIFDRGDDTGLQFFYIDDNVTNGITYYYALVAYDSGFGDVDNPDSQPIDPQENVFNISTTLAGNIVGISQNAAVVTPRSLPVGYIEGGANEDLSSVTGGIGTGSAEVKILVESDVDLSAIYNVNFFSEPAEFGELYVTTEYNIVNVATNETILPRTPLAESSPNVDGFSVVMNNVEAVDIVREKTGWVTDQGGANELFSINPTELEGYNTNWIALVREDTTGSFSKTPYDYELRWVSDSLYTPPRIFGFLREDIPVFAVNATTNEMVDLLIDDRNDNGVYDLTDDLIINDVPPGLGSRRFRYRIRFFTPQGETPVAPEPGNVLRVSVSRPFATGDYFQFTLRSSEIDNALAAEGLDQIAVVPNPYVGASEFEPRTQVEGRGERRVQFIHLPPTCTIKIFNIRGELVRTLEHNGGTSDGSEWWDLRTEGQQDVAFGVYLFHIEAPGIGEHVGKFALVK